MFRQPRRSLSLLKHPINSLSPPFPLPPRTKEQASKNWCLWADWDAQRQGVVAGHMRPLGITAQVLAASDPAGPKRHEVSFLGQILSPECSRELQELLHPLGFSELQHVGWVAKPPQEEAEQHPPHHVLPQGGLQAPGIFSPGSHALYGWTSPR